MHIRTADTTVSNFDIDIVFSPLLGLELAPLHLALRRLGLIAQPALKLVVCHGEDSVEWNKSV